MSRNSYNERERAGHGGSFVSDDLPLRRQSATELSDAERAVIAARVAALAERLGMIRVRIEAVTSAIGA
jgi:hypothetical protein